MFTKMNNTRRRDGTGNKTLVLYEVERFVGIRCEVEEQAMVFGKQYRARK